MITRAVIERGIEHVSINADVECGLLHLLTVNAMDTDNPGYISMTDSSYSYYIIIYYRRGGLAVRFNTLHTAASAGVTVARAVSLFRGNSPGNI